MSFVIDFLTPECRTEFCEIFGSSETAIDFYIHSYIEYKSKGGRKLTKKEISAIRKAKDVIIDRRNNIYGMDFIYFPPKEYSKELLALHFEFEEVDPECWEDAEGNIHSTFDTTVKRVQEALPDWEIRANCGGIDIRLI